MRWLPAIALAAATGGAAAGGAFEGARVFTSIAAPDCAAPAAGIVERYAQQGLAVETCPAPGGLTLYIVSSDARSWIDIGQAGTIWTTEDAVVYRHPVGLFPNVGGAEVVEWRVDDEEVSALIFRVVGQDPDGVAEGRQVTRLFVVRLAADGACLAGLAATNQAARALATAACVEPLEPRT